MSLDLSLATSLLQGTRLNKEQLASYIYFRVYADCLRRRFGNHVSEILLITCQFPSLGSAKPSSTNSGLFVPPINDPCIQSIVYNYVTQIDISPHNIMTVQNRDCLEYLFFPFYMQIRSVPEVFAHQVDTHRGRRNPVH